MEQHINLYERHIDWGDARISNLIFQGSDCAAVLDWEMARLGNPVQDLGLWIVMDTCLIVGIGIPRLEGLPDEAETIQHWERISGYKTEPKILLFYKLFAAFCFTFVMARLMTIEKQKGTMPAENTYDVDNLASQTLAKLLEAVGGLG